MTHRAMFPNLVFTRLKNVVLESEFVWILLFVIFSYLGVCQCVSVILTV